jgi:hypothetical protein
LQQTAIKRNDFFACGGYSVSGPVKGKLGKYGYLCLFCGSYRCNRCRNPKLKRVRARLAEIAQEHKLQRMATLTLDPKRIPRGERTDRYIRECWRKMRVLLAREFNGSLPFVGVLEFHKSGHAHLHVLLGRYIRQTWLSEAWQSIGGGKIVDIRFVDVHRVSAYLAVYLAGEKIVHTLKLLARRARIFTTARCIRLWPKREKCGWKLRRASLSVLYDAAENPSGERWEAIEDLRGFGLELLTYFESPPCAVALGALDVIPALRKALPIWKAGTFERGQR